MRICLIVLCCVMAQPALAKIYTWKDEQGKTRYTDYPPPASATSVSPGTRQTGVSGGSLSGLPDELDMQNGVFLHIRAMVQQRKFAELNRILHNYQRKFQSSPAAEPELFQLYYAFGKNDPSFERFLSDWVAAYPENYQPYLARARYYYDAGWEARGEEWASETSQAQFSGMARYFDKARADLDSVLRMYNKTIVPYTMLIGMAKAQGGDDLADRYLQEALRKNPATLEVRKTYLRMLAPRWGGSYEKMEAFVEESLRYSGKNPRLNLLTGYIFDDLAAIQVTMDMYSAAEELYAKALSYGENHTILFHMGRARHRDEKYSEALTMLNRAINLHKDNDMYFYWRARTYLKLEQFEKAGQDIDYAATLNPNDKYINGLRTTIAANIAQKAHDHTKYEQSAEALDSYDKALQLDPDNAVIRYNKAITLIEENQLDLALAELEKAIELDPDEISFYIAIDTLLARERQWDRIISYWDAFLLGHPNNSRAYLERSGTYYHKGDRARAIEDLKTSAEMGNKQAQELLKRFQ